jgi:hypothetical protein
MSERRTPNWSHHLQYASAIAPRLYIHFPLFHSFLAILPVAETQAQLIILISVKRGAEVGLQRFRHILPPRQNMDSDDYDREMEERMQQLERERKEDDDAANEEMVEEHFRREAERERLEKEYDEGPAEQDHREDAPEDDD